MLRRAIILRPYSLEREFGRMRVCLNNYLAHEVATRLNSIGIASELITDPELRENLKTRATFISSFRHDVSDLNTLFVHLLETAEQIAFPIRVSRAPVDLRALIEDLAAKILGLASERSASLNLMLPPHLPCVSGSYHWLYLGLFGVLSQALNAAPALTEVVIAARADDGQVEVVIAVPGIDEAGADPWPPPALFRLDDAHPRIGRLAVSDLTVTRAIFLLHAGELRVARIADCTEYTITLPV